MLYVITGATGNTGKPLAEGLLQEGHQVRVISRDPAKAKDLQAKGAEVIVGDTTNYETLNRAFAGADAVYFLIPPDPSQADFREYQHTVAENGAAALRTNKVPNVVTLSSVGAHLTEGAGVVQGLHVMERIFDSLSDTNVLHLRPGYFMENLLGQIGGIKQMGAMGAPVNPDHKLAMIATRDIANFALHRLITLDFKGHGNHIHLVGRKSYSYNDAAEIIGKALGMDNLRYAQVPMNVFHEFIVQVWGATPGFADQMIEFSEALNAGKIEELATEDAQRTSTSLEEFVDEVFKPIFSMS